MQVILIFQKCVEVEELIPPVFGSIPGEEFGPPEMLYSCYGEFLRSIRQKRYICRERTLYDGEGQLNRVKIEGIVNYSLVPPEKSLEWLSFRFLSALPPL